MVFYISPYNTTSNIYNDILCRCGKTLEFCESTLSSELEKKKTKVSVPISYFSFLNLSFWNCEIFEELESNLLFINCSHRGVIILEQAMRILYTVKFVTQRSVLVYCVVNSKSIDKVMIL